MCVTYACVRASVSVFVSVCVCVCVCVCDTVMCGGGVCCVCVRAPVCLHFVCEHARARVYVCVRACVRTCVRACFAKIHDMSALYRRMYVSDGPVQTICTQNRRLTGSSQWRWRRPKEIDPRCAEDTVDCKHCTHTTRVGIDYKLVRLGGILNLKFARRFHPHSEHRFPAPSSKLCQI